MPFTDCLKIRSTLVIVLKISSNPYELQSAYRQLRLARLLIFGGFNVFMVLTFLSCKTNKLFIIKM